MMSLSHTTGYAVHALGWLELEETGRKPRLVRDIARLAGIPRPYLSKIVNLLSKEGIVTTKRGHRGGIFLARSANSISLIEIVEAIEGKQWIANCLLGFDECDCQASCPLREFWQRTRTDLRGLLTHTMLSDVIQTAQKPSARRRSGAESPAAQSKRPIQADSTRTEAIQKLPPVTGPQPWGKQFPEISLTLKQSSV